MTSSGSQNPIVWLKENWSNMIETVYTVATNYGRECKENTVGTISQTEAREALKKHKGSVWKAVTECVEQRQKKVALLYYNYIFMVIKITSKLIEKLTFQVPRTSNPWQI